MHDILVCDMKMIRKIDDFLGTVKGTGHPNTIKVLGNIYENDLDVVAMTKLKTLKDIKISTSSTDDIEQMLIEHACLECFEKLKILAREWIKEKIPEKEYDLYTIEEMKEYRDDWIKHFFNLDLEDE